MQTTVRVPEGTSPFLNVSFALSYGASGSGVLAVVSSRVVSFGSNVVSSLLSASGAGLSSNALLVGDGLDDQVVFSFGRVVNAGDNVLDSGDDIVVEVVALVADVALNANSSSLPSVVSLDCTAASCPQQSSASLVVVEPALSVNVSCNATTIDAGDVVSYTAVVRHRPAPGSWSAAYNVSLAFLLDSSLDIQAQSVVSSQGSSVLSFSGAQTMQVCVRVCVCVCVCAWRVECV